MKYSIEELCMKKEDQVFDRKSARKDAKGLSNHIVAFANADLVSRIFRKMVCRVWQE